MNKRALAARLLSRTGLLPAARLASHWSGLLTLNYHRIGQAGNAPFDHGLWSADAETFDWQVGQFRQNLRIVVPEQLPALIEAGRGRYGMITFDDGYRDNYEVAFPILKSHGVRAVFFVATGYIDAPRVPWWDEIAWLVRTSERARIEMPDGCEGELQFDAPIRAQAVATLLRHYKRLPPARTEPFLDALAAACGRPRCPPELGRDMWMTWDMLREMRDAGMVIGAHTVTHPVLANLEPERQRWEILESCHRLQSELGRPAEVFSYPLGGLHRFNEATLACLRDSHIRYAASYYGGYRRFDDWQDYDIRRVAIESDLSRDDFRCLIGMPSLFARQEVAVY